MTDAGDQLPLAPLGPGDHRRLGATYDGRGTNIAVWAPDATSVDLCLFDDDGRETRHRLPEQTFGVWHGYVDFLLPGRSYGFRVDGPWDPAAGHLFSADKLLVDPYARAIDGHATLLPELAVLQPDGGRRDGDTAAATPRGIVTGGGGFDWGDDRRLDTPWSRTVVYEAHVRGLTRLHPDVPPALQGTYAGLGHPAVTSYLTDLGVTAVELLPVQHFESEPRLLAQGLANYWGYNTLGFFAPHADYAASGTRGEQVAEFKQMVKDLHAAGLEVILDVVYNHTAEGERTGPVLSFRGYDDGSYYLRDSAMSYRDVTGCGNTVQVSDPQVLRLVMDSLRYWVEEMHVDGFRFDLAPAMLRRPRGSVDLNAPFLTAVHQDPVLREVKLIAEPWDVTGEGYLVGRFPSPWCEWNDKYRDAVRDFWRAGSDGVRALASRVSGSSDLYADDGRLPFASVNFVTSHDGFTVRDLVSYEQKRNEANGEDNQDGSNDNRSWNCGVEGETDDADVERLRGRQAANLLATLLLSTGVPMLTAGDERGRTQRGNNNAFCHDDELAWVSWETDPHWRHLHALTRQLLALRAAHPVLRRRHFFAGAHRGPAGRKDISWLRPDGEELAVEDWHDTRVTTLGVFMAGDALPPTGDPLDSPEPDTSYLIWMHAGADPIDVTLPGSLGKEYALVLRTDVLSSDDDAPRIAGEATTTLAPHSLTLYEAIS